MEQDLTEDQLKFGKYRAQFIAESGYGPRGFFVKLKTGEYLTADEYNKWCLKVESEFNILNLKPPIPSRNPQFHKHMVSYSNLVIGMRVQDDEGHVGIVKECNDIHNVYVEYDNGGNGLHCLIEECIETTTINGQLIEIPHYHPLYYCD